ncbi:Rieske 2Fe-2S domain-containing protein [Azospirillum sp. B506]|uniref:Rieske 2Fe-2S domain-containing protein n=1 Tax=Azospirillum sp. B506 TaxID=137721 RepID=UPI0005B28655|nr:Rieske 2Fe-2S domain-containing protein [Azospirillum sp. B506]
MTTIDQPIDEGTAYGMAEPSYNRDLVETGRGTLMGELFRRYWIPVGLSSEVTDTPRMVRILGEDLVLFRDRQGRAGLLYHRCMHRGTSLYYGRVEEQGIRCCYHGWLFDVQGRCVEQACELEGGRRLERYRQPWYPVEERYGLVFAYMGPPDRKPVLPRYEELENLAEDEFLEANGDSLNGGGPPIIDYNWLQNFENFADSPHLMWLHILHSGPQFGDRNRLSKAGATIDPHQVLKALLWEETPNSVKSVALEKRPDGTVFRYVMQLMLPAVRAVPNPLENAALARAGTSIAWLVPLDDTHHRIFTVARVKQTGAVGANSLRMNGKLWKEMTEEEHRAYPADYEAELGQGPITFHSEEHLVQGDRGVIMLRKLLLREARLVAEGKDPAGVSFDPATAPVKLEAGLFPIVTPEPVK